MIRPATLGEPKTSIRVNPRNVFPLASLNGLSMR